MPAPLSPSDDLRIPGLTFRRFRGETDYPAMVEIMNACNRADQAEYNESVEDISRIFSHLTNCDPYTDMLFAEVEGEPAGYARVFWKDEHEGPRLYIHLGFVVPAWRRRGLGRRILAWSQARLREIAADHPAELQKVLHAWSTDAAPGANALLESSGYRVARTMHGMTRPIEPIPEPLALPKGLQIRPALPEHYRAIWNAREEAYRDHWGYAPRAEKDYVTWQESRRFQPVLWKTAWDGDEVAGMVLNHVDVRRNDWVGIDRGYTQDIFVRRPWRRRGLARALLVESIRMFASMGKVETLLGVDSENPFGAHRLYESVGYRPYREHYVYRKPLTV